MNSSNSEQYAEPTSTETAPAVPDYLASPNAVFGDAGVEWRYGKPPDYSKTRKVWEEGKKMNHVAGSLPQLVENLVKNWEVEASFKPRLQDWRTIDHEKYSFAMGGGCPQTGEHMLKVGTYNAIIAPNEYYSPEYSDFASSHKTFKRMMPTFAWEVMEVYSGPPKVAFKWRHWGVMKNDYVGFNNKGEKVTAKAHGGPIEIFGVTLAEVDDKVRLQAVDTWMDPLAMFRQIAPYGVVNKEVMNHKVDNAEAPNGAPDNDGAKIAQEHNRADGEHSHSQASEAVAGKHLSRSTGQPADADVPQFGACPFTAQQTAIGDKAMTDDDTSDGGPHVNSGSENTTIDSQGSGPRKAQHLTSMSIENASAEEIHPGGLQSASDDLVLEAPCPGTEGPAERANGHAAEAIFTAAADHPADVEIDTSPSSVHQPMATSANADESTVFDDAREGAQDSTERISASKPEVKPAGSDVPQSIYSSAVTGEVEDVIKTARSADFIDESTAYGTHDVFDEHLEQPADKLHPHLKEVEHEVNPAPGEAVAAPADSKETRNTHEEMSSIRPEEIIMNRE